LQSKKIKKKKQEERMIRRLKVLIIIILLSSCVRTRVIVYETTPRTPKPSDYPIEILDIANIDKPYKVIGVVKATPKGRRSPEAILEKLRTKAREMGGDALIDLTIGEGDKVIIPTGNLFVVKRGETWTAKVIVWQ
jgi:hypothetical protein